MANNRLAGAYMVPVPNAGESRGRMSGTHAPKVIADMYVQVEVRKATRGRIEKILYASNYSNAGCILGLVHRRADRCWKTKRQPGLAAEQ